MTIFGSIGQSSSETTINLLGDYVIETTLNVNGTDVIEKDALKDPIDLDFTSKNICLDAGLRLKLAFFSLFGSVNKAEYTSYNGGIALSVR